jgi:hypothetical protein
MAGADKLVSIFSTMHLPVMKRHCHKVSEIRAGPDKKNVQAGGI